MKGLPITALRWAFEVAALPFLLLTALLARVRTRPIHVGLGPEPMINNVYHKKALTKAGYSAETFVTAVYYITGDFDHKLIYRFAPLRLLAPLLAFALAVHRYRCLYVYFNGGPLTGTRLLWRLEPTLLRLAAVRLVVMPYGSDVQCLERCPNLSFRHAVGRDYPGYRLQQPRVRQRIDLWLRHADHVIAGCDWVDYLYYWDTLMLGHFSIDTEHWCAPPLPARSGTLRVLHAPNHRTIKGTAHFLRAVEELRAEGVDIELVLAEKVPNEQIRALMQEVDVVADQLVIGWYAMFALEAMALGKAVLCHVREDLHRLYQDAGLIDVDELPLIDCSPATVKETLRRLATDRGALEDIGRRGRAFVEKHHSLEAVGGVFHRINQSMGLAPANESAKR